MRDMLNDDYDQAERWNALSAQLGLGKPRTNPRPWANIGRWAAVAAALVVLVITGINYISNTKQNTNLRTHSTSIGQMADVTLPDGSRAVLGPATVLHVDGRNIDITGEAVFTVTKHTGAPFIVRTGNTVTRVLGTTFSVRAYDVTNVRVAVQDGKVAFRSDVLSAGDVATIINNTSTVQHNANISTLMSWTSGRLSFENAALGDVLADLGRWYPIEFVLADPSLAERRVSVTFESRRREDVLNLLGTVLGVPVSSSGRVITLGATPH